MPDDAIPPDGSARSNERERLRARLERDSRRLAETGQRSDRINRGRWAIICGMAAGRLNGRDAICPHRTGTPAARCWEFGRRLVSRQTRSSATDKLDISAATVHPGRGRAKEGPRSDWSGDELDLLEFCAGGVAELEPVIVAAMLPGRNADAVRHKRRRLAAARETT